MLVCACGGTTYANGGHEDPAAIEPDGKDPRYAELYEGLLARGYEPVGPGFMWLVCYMRFWVYRTRVWAFRSRAGRRFAFLHGYPHLPGWYQVYFATCFTDDRLLLTFGGVGPTRTDTDDLVRQAVLSDDPGRVEERHVRGEGELEDEGWQRDPDLGLETLLRAAEWHARETTTGPGAALARKELATYVLPMSLVAGGLGWWFGFDQWLAPFVLLGGTLVYLLVIAVKTAGAAEALRRRADEERDSGW
jgi:hypothetical protein